jgi:hypothetical protein
MMIKNNLSPDNSNNKQRTFFGDVTRSYIIATTAGFIAYPLDTLKHWAIVDMALSKKTFQQNASNYYQPATFSGLAKNAYKIGGMRIFYHGAVVNVARNAVVMACLHLGIWKWLMKLA